MAHPRHVHVPGGIYLVSSIGERDKQVFVDEGDRVALSELVAQVIARCGAQIHAFSWLESEILLVLQVYGVSLSGVMRRIASVHARRVNEKLGYKGPLFQHPHRATWLGDCVSVLEGVLTVHMSSVRVHLANDPALYPWSSYRAYMGLDEVPWLTKRTALELASTVPDAHTPGYARIVNRNEAWMQALQETGNSPDKRVLSPYDEFHAWHKLRALERAKPASLDQLILAVARWLQVDPAAIESDVTSPLLSLSRALIVWLAMKNGIASLSELGRRFERARSTLYETRETYRVRVPQLFDIRLPEILEGPGIAASEVLRLIGAGPNGPSFLSSSAVHVIFVPVTLPMLGP